jgi:sialate O-acetylesterase
MVGPNDHVALEFADGQAIALGDGWFYRKVPSAMPGPPRTPWESLGGLTGLSNAMIAPLEGLKLSGAIWYQGETDAGDPGPYELLLTALTRDWRTRFGAALPFLVVQLPNFGQLATGPVESGWAAIRDAQHRVAAAHPATGLVVSIDAGDRSNLHPPDKRVIGRRAADVARLLVYGQPGIPDGLSPAAAYRQGDEVVVDFSAAPETLMVVSAARPIAFELCGAAPGSCVYADARLAGNRVYLSAPDITHATRVRHCWADAPVCNLYGTSGLPVSSFEIQVAAAAGRQDDH